MTSPQADGSINCSDEVRARITLTNRASTGVAITGILKSSGIPSGRCFGDGDFTYRSLNQIVFANSTAVVFDQPLYGNNGSACCDGTGCAGSCVFQQSFQVVTELGNVPAGMFSYRVFFQNCRSCAGASAAAGSRTCAPASMAAAPSWRAEIAAAR